MSVQYSVPPFYQSTPQQIQSPFSPPPPYASSGIQPPPPSQTPLPPPNGYPAEKMPYQLAPMPPPQPYIPPGTNPISHQQPPLQPAFPLGTMPDPSQSAQMQQFFQNVPPEKVQLMVQQQMQQQQYQQPSPPGYDTISPAIPMSVNAAGAPPMFNTTQSLVMGKDEKQTGKVQRFLGDTLVGRFARAGVQSASSALKMPTYLSPYGDNEFYTAPNVRVRDVALFATFACVGVPLVDGVDSAVTGAFGADSFISELVSSGAGAIVGSTVLKYGIFQIVEQAIDKGVLEHLLPEEEKMLQSTTSKSLQVGVKHKLMDVEADLRFTGLTTSRDPKSCAKGWFCPYLYASSRTPLVPRANDFSMAQCHGPSLTGDAALAHKLLSESTNVLSLCDPDPTHDIGTPRLLILFTGISPFRANMWSSSRRPGCATLIFHIFDGCPALVVPVTARAPVVAWSPWTWSQMKSGIAAGYDPALHHQQLCEWIDEVISLPHVLDSLRDKYVDVLGRAASLVVNGALALSGAMPTVLGKMNPERAGIVLLRY